MEICGLQHKSSGAWNLDEVINMIYSEGITRTTFHQCMYGLEARDQLGSAPAYKPTSILTNHSALAEGLQKRCAGGHRHVQLVGKHACSRAATYPRGLCDAVVKGIQIVKKRCEEITAAQKKTVELGGDSVSWSSRGRTV